jgi:SlyX protein
MTDSKRLDALEMRIAHQDETIEDLNRIVTDQWKAIDRLTREVAMLTERVKQAEQAALTGDPGDEPPPPHW